MLYAVGFGTYSKSCKGAASHQAQILDSAGRALVRFRAYVDVQDLLKNLSQYLSCIQLRTAIRADPDVGDVENYVVDNDRETRNEDEDIEEPKTKMEIDWSGIANTITAVKNWFTHRFVHRTIVKQNDDNLEYRRRFTRRPCSVEHLSYVDDAEKDGCPGAGKKYTGC